MSIMSSNNIQKVQIEQTLIKHLKTNFIMFSNKNKIINTEILNVLIDNIVIDQVYNTKFLGVVNNSNLTWHDHIKAISNKVSKSIGILLRIRKQMSKMMCY